jgi:hypothetical protein
VVLRAFFTQWSSLVQQKVELDVGLQAQQIDLFSRPESTAEMISHFV